jgi:nucleoid DNA-binding protein
MVQHGALRQEAERRVDEILATLGPELARAGSADVPGVGTFVARGTVKPARQGINPFTRQPITFPARRICRIRFDPDPALFDAVNRPAEEPAGASDPLLLAFVTGLRERWGKVELPGVGRFRVYKVPARRSLTNPRTGAVTPALATHRDVRFSPSSKLKAQAFPGDVADEDEDEDEDE